MLKGMHLNDAKSEHASRVDRHAPLGDGNIGIECFKCIMGDERFDDIPLVLETPEVVCQIKNNFDILIIMIFWSIFRIFKRKYFILASRLAQD